MKFIIIFLALTLAMACGTPPEPPAPTPPDPPPPAEPVLPPAPPIPPAPPRNTWSIDLSELPTTGRYLSLDTMRSPVTIGGHWKGDRLVIRGASGKVVVFVPGCVVESTHPEDAVAFDGDVTGTEVRGLGAAFVGGGLTFWGKLDRVTISGLVIQDAHTGVRATKAVPHRQVTIKGVTVTDCSHEGFYIGASARSAIKGEQLIIEDCTCLRAGWDCAQAGNMRWVYIRRNTFDRAGLRKTGGQDYAITINHCAEVFIEGNAITNTPKALQDTGTRLFLHGNTTTSN